MAREHDQNLERPENWSFELAEAKEATQPKRVIVSVAFPRQDYETVAEYAIRHNLRVSEFIRNAATQRAQGALALEAMSGTLGARIAFPIQRPYGATAENLGHPLIPAPETIREGVFEVAQGGIS